ncbi:MAG: hypothetical protein ABSG68_25965 [Thermoguttaceae bacterium]|jgi:hypothetical protein
MRPLRNKPTAEQVAKSVLVTMARQTRHLKHRINANRSGHTAAEIYAAMGTAGAAIVQEHLTRTDAALAALAAAAAAAAAPAVATAASTTPTSPTAAAASAAATAAPPAAGTTPEATASATPAGAPAPAAAPTAT